MAFTKSDALFFTIAVFLIQRVSARSTTVPPTCKDLPSPEHGTTVCNDLGYLLVCTASCNTGFEFPSLSPVERRYCTSYSGTWLNGNTFSPCKRHKNERELCQSITPPYNGVVRCENSASQLICSAQCNAGYMFETGDSVVQRVCDTFDGVWFNGKDFPKCIQNRTHCQPSSAPVFGVLDCQTTNAKMICTAVCQQGYAFETGETSVQRTCDLATGVWEKNMENYPLCNKSASVPKCRAIDGDNTTNVRCDDNGSELICTASCTDGYSFETGDLVIKKVCDQFDGTWFNGNQIPNCIVPCDRQIISTNKEIKAGDFDASSVWQMLSGVHYGPDRARIDSLAVIDANHRHLGGGWRPAVDNLNQYIQVNLKNLSRINGVITKGQNVVNGDTSRNYVTRFRVLYSIDGLHFVSYGDDTVPDKFFAGNSDTDTPVTNMFSCPFDALYVRLNPLEWNEHIGLRFELLGCDSAQVEQSSTTQELSSSSLSTTTTVTSSTTKTTVPTFTKTTVPSLTVITTQSTTTTEPKPACTSPLPPKNGIVNCVNAGEQMICSGLCNTGFSFRSSKTIEKLTCELKTGMWDNGKIFPDCESSNSSDVHHNESSTHGCIARSLDCQHLPNGDYQTCGDCHFFASCSEGYVYVRPCPTYLVFDSMARRCLYSSKTCVQKPSMMPAFG